jgi:hypothetical protein
MIAKQKDCCNKSIRKRQRNFFVNEERLRSESRHNCQRTSSHSCNTSFLYREQYRFAL